MSITGPYNATGISETPSRKRIFACHPARPADEAACAKTIVTALARRAYRRPPTADDVQTLLTFYQQGRADGGFENGIEMALRALLVSPKFLFRVEEDPANVAPNTPYRLSDLELASRLSFFLWSSIPDDELLDVAARGRLHDPAVLERQVRRMLADPRSEALVDQLRRPVAVSAQPRRRTARIRGCFRTSTTTCGRRSAARRSSSSRASSRGSQRARSAAGELHVRQRAAGEALRHPERVRQPLPARDASTRTSPRGGLLGQGSILTVTSYANRTSPVLRGKWMLENLLGTPPPPPPPNVPPLKEDATAPAARC